MRWFWIDRFTEFQSGERAKAVKAVSLVEEHIDHYNPGFPFISHALMLEGMAQVSGLLVGETSEFINRVVLAKASKVVYHDITVPGDVLEYEAIVERLDDTGAMTQCVARLGGKIQAEANLVFAYLDDRFKDVELFVPHDFLKMIRIFGLYDVAVNSDGTPVKTPQWLLDAEQQSLYIKGNPANVLT